jgi:hypothetical protein
MWWEIARSPILYHVEQHCDNALLRTPSTSADVALVGLVGQAVLPPVITGELREARVFSVTHALQRAASPVLDPPAPHPTVRNRCQD